MRLSLLVSAALLARSCLADSLNGFTGCNATEKAIIKTAWMDAVHMVRFTWSWYHTTTSGKYHELDQRFMKDPNDGKPHYEIVSEKFRKISLWHAYHWPPWEYLWGRKIQVACEDLPNKAGTTCESQGGIGAYTLNEKGPQIVLCSIFMNDTMSLADRTEEIRKHPSDQKNPTWWINQAQLFLHEMTHLNVINQKGDYKVSILDRKQNPVDGYGNRVYGAKLCEKFAEKWPTWTKLNADNYAWLANTYWFARTYGLPDSVKDTADTALAPNTFRDEAEDTQTTVDLADQSNTLSLAELEALVDDSPDLEKLQPPVSLKVTGRKLRILALGDSITNGYKSSDNRGYRGPLEDALKVDNTVEIINEGHNGAVIDEISDFATASLKRRPNVILIHAGTNDASKNVDVANAPQRLSALIDKVRKACPDASVLVALIIASTGSAQPRIAAYNDAVKDVLTRQASQGQHVDLVDISSLLSSSEMADGLHPNDAGYKKMAEAWMESLKRANFLNWIKEPVAAAVVPCANTPTWYPQGQIAGGGGLGRNEYRNITCTDYITESGPAQCQCTPSDPDDLVYVDFKVGPSCELMSYEYVHAVQFADLNGDGRDDYLWVSKEGSVTAYINSGPTQDGINAGHVGWLPQGIIGGVPGAARQEIIFADLNGDGRAEFIRVFSNGSIDVWLNGGGSDNGPNAGKIKWIPQGRQAGGIGAPGSAIRFADLNGDGRAEYLALDGGGGITAYLNGGFSDGHITWIPQGKIGSGVGAKRINAVFADMNGDGRADYLNVQRVGSGAVTLYQNQGGPDNGPNAAKVSWWGRGQITGGDGTPGSQLIFGDLDGDGRDEYLLVDPATSAVKAYLNGCPP